MDDLTVLVTGAGSPGIAGTLYSVRNNFENRKIRTVGTDIKSQVAGRYLCDSFYTISPPSREAYKSDLFTVCKKEAVDVILPQNTAELPVIARLKKEFSEIGTNVAISDSKAINIANNKYSLLKLAKKAGIPVPRFFKVTTFSELEKHSTQLGWPEIPVVIKPPQSNGMRGVRIIHESVDRKKLFYKEKPDHLFAKMDEMQEILGEKFPDLLVMDNIPGPEYTIDMFHADKLMVALPRRRDAIKSGITFHGIVEKNENIIEFSRILSENINLSFAYGFQFKLDSTNTPIILESNPRIQGTMVLSTFAGANIIYASIKAALSESIPDFQINWNTEIIRYWGGIGISSEKIIGTL